MESFEKGMVHCKVTTFQSSGTHIRSFDLKLVRIRTDFRTFEGLKTKLH